MKTSERWLLFEYKGLELAFLSKPFKTKKLVEKARQKYPDRVRRKIGIGVAHSGDSWLDDSGAWANHFSSAYRRYGRKLSS